MTEDRMALLELVEKHGDGDFLRELGQWTLQRLMELEAEAKCGATRHERSAERVNHRNGYRERTLQTRIGALDLRIPKLRSGSYYPSFLAPRKGSERALVAVVQEAYVKGVSPRKVDDLVHKIRGYLPAGNDDPFFAVMRPYAHGWLLKGESLQRSPSSCAPPRRRCAPPTDAHTV
jgi:transposase-like protein